MGIMQKTRPAFGQTALEIRYDRPKARRLALVMAAIFVIGAGLLAWSVTLDELGAMTQGALQGGAAGMMIAGVLQGLAFRGMARRAEPIVTIDHRGVAFHLAGVPPFPWDQIRSAGVMKLLNGVQFAVLVEEPAPRLGGLAAWRQAVTRRQQEGAIRFAIPVSRLDVSGADIEKTIVSHRPVPMLNS